MKIAPKAHIVERSPAGLRSAAAACTRISFVTIVSYWQVLLC